MVLGGFKENGKPAVGLKFRPDGCFDTFASFECVYSIQGGDITLYRPQEQTFDEHFTGETITIGLGGTTVHFEPHTTKVYWKDTD